MATSALPDLLSDLADGRVELVDLTAPLSERTPVIKLPPPFANTNGFSLQEISRYDDRGPAWYWNNISAGEHVGTHFDAPVHWVSGKDGLDVAEVPATQLIGPAVVVDKSAECADDPDFLLEIEHLEAWQREHGPLPKDGWLLFRTGWDSRAHDQQAFLNVDAKGSHTPGVSVELAKWLANARTGLTEAAKSRTPLVLVAADTAAAAIRSNFRIAQDQLVDSAGALHERVLSPETAVADAARA